jgi:pSer/pThr/pTyr-binding forkhead associated (FHA) protein
LRAILPYREILRPATPCTDDVLDDLVREVLAGSDEKPGYVELFDEVRQHLLFLREKQVYAAGTAPWGSTDIRDFFLAAQEMSSPRIAAYACDPRMLHSILIPFQKKADLQVDTALADLDEVLDQVETEEKTCVILAQQDHHIAMLRYERGKARGLYLNPSFEPPRGDGLREDFLVRVYTLSAEAPVSVSLFSDLRVTYARDARQVPTDHLGSLARIFLARPPVLILKFKEREIRRYNLDRKRISVGRTAENDIPIDNLAVSRTHCYIEEHRGYHYVVDNDSLNGTLVNGTPVGRYCLTEGDEVTVGKHTLLYRSRTAAAPTLDLDGFDQTVIMSSSTPPQGMSSRTGTPSYSADRASDSTAEPSPSTPSFGGAEGTPPPPSDVPLLRPAGSDNAEVIAIESDLFLFGKSEKSDVRLEGFLAADTQAQIRKYGSNYILEHLGGWKKTRANGCKIKKHVLKNNDRIRVADREFIYQD